MIWIDSRVEAEHFVQTMLLEDSGDSGVTTPRVKDVHDLDTIVLHATEDDIVRHRDHLPRVWLAAFAVDVEVIGQRSGYRDERFEFEVRGGRIFFFNVVVRCSEVCAERAGASQRALRARRLASMCARISATT